MPLKMIERIKLLIQKFKMYPSRSEFVRTALREFLIRELKNLEKYEALAREENLPRLPLDFRTIGRRKVEEIELSN